MAAVGVTPEAGAKPDAKPPAAADLSEVMLLSCRYSAFRRKYASVERSIIRMQGLCNLTGEQFPQDGPELLSVIKVLADLEGDPMIVAAVLHVCTLTSPPDRQRWTQMYTEKFETPIDRFVKLIESKHEHDALVKTFDHLSNFANSRDNKWNLFIETSQNIGAKYDGWIYSSRNMAKPRLFITLAQPPTSPQLTAEILNKWDPHTYPGKQTLEKISPWEVTDNKSCTFLYI